MRSELLLFVAGAIVVYAVDLRFALRQRNRKAAMIAGILLVTAGGIVGCKIAGWPNPVQLLHAWLSPVGKIIWRS